MPYKNKKIAVLGFGSSGEAAARLLAEEGAMTTILDSADLKKLRSKIEKITPLGISVLAGLDADKDTRKYDRGILSPGIDPIGAAGAEFSAQANRDDRGTRTVLGDVQMPRGRHYRHEWKDDHDRIGGPHAEGSGA